MTAVTTLLLALCAGTAGALQLTMPLSGSRVAAAASRTQQSRRAGIRMDSVSGVARNGNFAKLQAGYLFPEINRRRKAYLETNPDADIISLGIGDTTQPIPDHILSGLVGGASALGKTDTYSGYGAEQGMGPLREKIASKLYDGLIEPDDVFVSDGAKCDIARLQMMFGSTVVSAVQDPSYPVYVDTSVMMGQTGLIDTDKGQFNNIVYMPCNPSNAFFPDLSRLVLCSFLLKSARIDRHCSNNNPECS